LVGKIITFYEESDFNVTSNQVTEQSHNPFQRPLKLVIIGYIDFHWFLVWKILKHGSG
jgi:hypothetical protein